MHKSKLIIELYATQNREESNWKKKKKVISQEIEKKGELAY